jgi:hypothetical protein
MELWDTKRQRCVVVEDNVIAATIVGDTAYALKSGDRGVMLEARLGEDGSMERTIHALPFDVHKAWAIDVSPNQQWLLMSPTNGDFYRLNLSRGTSDSIPLWRNLINLGLGPACISSAGEPFAYTICPGDNCIASLAVPEGLLRDKWIIGRWRARTGDALCGIEDNDLVFLSLLSKRHISMGLNAQRVNATSGCPVFAVTSNQGVHLVDAKTGDVVDSFAAKGKSAFPAAVDAVWVVRRNGEIMLWRRLYGKGLRGFIQRTDVWATAWVLIGLSVWSLWIRVQRRRRLGG